MRPDPTPRRRLPRVRLPVVAALVCAVFGAVLAGCDLMTVTTTPRPSRDIATPEPTPSPTPTELDETPTLRPDPSGSAPGLLDAANALADLRSYRVSIVSRGIVAATPPGGSVSMVSTLVQGAEPAAEFTMTGVDGFVGGRLSAVVIGDQAWLKEGAAGWHKSPGGAADFDAAFTTLSPIDLVTEFDGLSEALRRVGPATRNGQKTTHYQTNADDVLATQAGLSSGTVDAWISTRGGDLIALVIDGTWDGDDGPAHVVLKIDVTRINDPSNAVVRPI
jgi:hypothetical protein